VMLPPLIPGVSGCLKPGNGEAVKQVNGEVRSPLMVSGALRNSGVQVPPRTQMIMA
jgi:hypothetical protein